jgi:hypothetical protein
MYLLRVSLEHVWKIYSEREEVWMISWKHQSFGKSEIVMSKVSKVQKLWFLRYTLATVSQSAYIHGLNEDRVRTVDEVMKTCG